MPRGLMIKRNPRTKEPFSYRVRHNSVEDRSDGDSGSDYESNNIKRETTECTKAVDNINVYQPMYADPSLLYAFLKQSAKSSFVSNHIIPTSVSSLGKIQVPSPLYLSTFDRLTVSSPNNVISNTSPIPVTSCIRYAPSRQEQTTSESNVQNIDNEPMNLVTSRESVTSPGVKVSSPVLKTPPSPKKRNSTSTVNQKRKEPATKRPKAARKLNFDEDTSSPVSGTLIRELTDQERQQGTVIKSGDIDPSMNIVEVTPEAQAEIAKINNKIGDYNCRLCKETYPDAFKLAQHRCSRIIYIEYKCSECDKVFNCPANLASHRRWHKPKIQQVTTSGSAKILPSNDNSPNFRNQQTLTESSRQKEGLFACNHCGKKFRRHAYLRKHVTGHHAKEVTTETTSDTGTNASPRNSRSPDVNQNITVNSFVKIVQSSTVNIHDVNGNSVSTEVNQPQSPQEAIFSCRHCDADFPNSSDLTTHVNERHNSRQVILFQLPTTTRP